MHRNLFLLLLPIVACQTEATTRGPTATTIAIMETEPAERVDSPPLLVSVFDAPETTVEADGFAAVRGESASFEDIPLPRNLAVEVRAGENLVLLARWADSSVEAVAELNGLDVSEPLYPGQSLLMPTADEAADAGLVESRESFAQARLERYLQRRGGLMAVDEHRVRTGETAWGIARNQLGIPTWVLEAYNPDADLDRLSIGERLVVPVLSDTVAEVETSIPTVETEDVWGETGRTVDEALPPTDLSDELSPQDLPSASETVTMRAEISAEIMDEEPPDSP